MKWWRRSGRGGCDAERLSKRSSGPRDGERSMSRADAGTDAEDRRGSKLTLAQMALYFLRLGALGFGGPVALANTMRRDFAEERHWLTEPEYEDGLAIAAACPGPLAYQLGVYCGYVRHGVAGGLAVALAFALAPFALVVAAAWAYTRLSAGRPSGGTCPRGSSRFSPVQSRSSFKRSCPRSSSSPGRSAPSSSRRRPLWPRPIVT